MPPLGLYFYTYDYLKQRLRGDSLHERFSVKLISGGTAGTLCWLVAFPMDVVKTQMMLSDSKHP